MIRIDRWSYRVKKNKYTEKFSRLFNTEAEVNEWYKNNGPFFENLGHVLIKTKEIDYIYPGQAIPDND